MTQRDRPDYAGEIRAALRNPADLCGSLNLLAGATKQARGLMIRCPEHKDTTASCSVRLVDGGWLAVKCHGCDFTGDALTLVAVVKGLDLRGQFREVLIEGAKLAGLHQVVQELETGEVSEERPNVPPAPPQDGPAAPERDYPARLELDALWRDSGPVADDPDASGALVARRIDPAQVDQLELARCFQRGISADRLPRWATYRGQTWRDSGHRMLVKAYDSDGEWRSVRAWRVTDGTTPKRLPPGGHKAAGLVLANRLGVAMLRGERAGRKVVILEGEPDTLVWSLTRPDLAVIGVISGSWHQGFAERIPLGSEVVIRTHIDEAGEKYAMQILATIKDRAQVYRIQVAQGVAA